MSEDEFPIDELEPWDGPEINPVTDAEKQNDLRLVEAYGLNVDVELEEIDDALTEEDVLTARKQAKQNCLYRGDLTLYERELASILYKKYLLSK